MNEYVASMFHQGTEVNAQKRRGVIHIFLVQIELTKLFLKTSANKTSLQYTYDGIRMEGQGQVVEVIEKRRRKGTG